VQIYTVSQKMGHVGCHGIGYSWYSAALIILMVDYKILIHD